MILTPQITESAHRPENGWWAVYTRHQHEKVIADMLLGKGMEVFLPLYESMRRWKDRQKVLSLPLFPGYVFVRAAGAGRLQVVSTPGVHMILSRGEKEAVIPESEIEAIRRTVEGPFRPEPHPFLKCGERVRVTRGPLQGLEGILVRKKTACRLVLSVDMLTQSVAVEIDAVDVEAVHAQEGQGMAGAGQSAGELASSLLAGRDRNQWPSAPAKSGVATA